MRERPAWDAELEARNRVRVAEGALRQAARHERAIDACLSELTGVGAPDLATVAAMLRRARHHGDRARGLAQMAARINRDPSAAPTVAACLERQERNARRISDWRPPRPVHADRRRSDPDR